MVIMNAIASKMNSMLSANEIIGAFFRLTVLSRDDENFKVGPPFSERMATLLLSAKLKRHYTDLMSFALLCRSS